MRDSYRYAEKMLYSFPVNLMRIMEVSSALRVALQSRSCRAQTYDQLPASEGTHSDPVAQHAEQVEHYRLLLRRLHRQTDTILRVRQTLKHSRDERDKVKFCVMELYYFEKQKAEQVAEKLSVSLRTLSRMRCELVNSVLAGQREEYNAVSDAQ